MLARAIRLYRRSQATRTLVRAAIRLHHRLVPAARMPCQLADCSGTGLAEATALGWKALPVICDRISRCGGAQAGCGDGGFGNGDPGCTRL